MQGQARATKLGRQRSIVLAYVVQPGDTLSVITDTIGSSVEAITAARHLQPLSHLPRHDAGRAQQPRDTGLPTAEKRRWPRMKNWLRNWSPCSRRQDRAWRASRGWKRVREPRALRPRR